MEEFVRTTTMTSTSLAALHLRYGVKPCRVILERLEGLEPSQRPGPATPRQASKARTKAPKFRYGRSRTGSSRSRKKRSKTHLKVVIRPQHHPRYPGNKDVTSEEPPPEKELSDVTVTTCQPSDGAKAPKDGSSQVERSRPRVRCTRTPSSRVYTISEFYSHGPGDESEKEKKSRDQVVATPQPPAIATKAPKKRRSQTPHSHLEKVQALALPLQVCARPDEPLGDHGKENETGNQVMVTPQFSEIRTEEADRATGRSSLKEHTVTPASHVCTRLEELPSDRADGSERREGHNQASTTRRARRKTTPKWRHGVIRRRRPRRKLVFATPAPVVCGGRLEQLFVHPVDNSALLLTSSEPPTKKELGGQPMPERPSQRTIEMELGHLPEEKEPPTETRSGNQLSGRDHRAWTLEPPGDEGFTVATSQEPPTKAAGPNRRRSCRQRRGVLPAALYADATEATAGMVYVLPPAEEGSLPVQETASLCGTYVEESVTTISLEDTTVDHTTMLVPIGGKQWAVISGEVVQPRPKELYLERRDLSPRPRTTKGRRKHQRKNLFTAPKKRGRPPKNAPVEAKKRGRPRKDAATTPPATKRSGRARKNTSEPPKRRGRPPKNPLQPPEGKGRRGRQQKNTPAPSPGRRRPGRPRKTEVVAWIDPSAQKEDGSTVCWTWGPSPQDDYDDKSDWETSSNVSSATFLNQGFQFPDEDSPEPEKKKPRKRRGAQKKTTAGPPKKRGRPRKNPLEVASSSQGTSSAKGRASRRKTTPGPVEDKPDLTLANFQSQSPASQYYSEDDDNDWETCSNFSTVTADGNSYLEDILLPDVDWPAGPSRSERVDGLQDPEVSQRRNDLRRETSMDLSDDEASSVGGDRMCDWETASNLSSDWNSQIGAMLLPPDSETDGSGRHIVTEPDDQVVTYQELVAAAPPHQPSPSHSPVLLKNSMVAEGSSTSLCTVAEPADEEEVSEASGIVATDKELPCTHTLDQTEPSSVLAAVGGESGSEPDVITLSSDDSGCAGADRPGSGSTSIVVSDLRTEDSVLEIPDSPGICIAGSSEPEVIEISDDSDLDDGSYHPDRFSSPHATTEDVPAESQAPCSSAEEVESAPQQEATGQPEAPELHAETQPTKEVADVQLPPGAAARADTGGHANTQAPVTADTPTLSGVQTVADFQSPATDVQAPFPPTKTPSRSHNLADVQAPVNVRSPADSQAPPRRSIGDPQHIGDPHQSFDEYTERGAGDQDTPGEGMSELEEYREFCRSYNSWMDRLAGGLPSHAEGGFSGPLEYSPVVSDEDDDAASQEMESEAKDLEGNHGHEEKRGDAASADTRSPSPQSCLGDTEGEEGDTSDWDVCSHASSIYCAWNPNLDTRSLPESSWPGEETSDFSGAEMSDCETASVISSAASDWNSDFDAMLASDTESEDLEGFTEAEPDCEAGTCQAPAGNSEALKPYQEQGGGRSRAEKPCEDYGREVALHKLREEEIVPHPGVSSEEDAGLPPRWEPVITPGTSLKEGLDEELAARQVPESEKDVRGGSRRKRGRPRRKQPLYVDTKARSSRADKDDYRPARKEPASEPATSQQVDTPPSPVQKRKRGRPRKTPFLPPEIINALTRDSDSDYDAEREISSEDEETKAEETPQLSEAEARRRDVQKKLRIAPFSMWSHPPKRRSGYKRWGDSEWDPDYVVPDDKYEPHQEEEPAEVNYTVRQVDTASPSDSTGAALNELPYPGSSSENAINDKSENGLDDKMKVLTAFSAMECKEALHDELFCDECGVDHPGDCPVHGPLIHVSDTHVPKGTPMRANKTLPDGLEIRRSAMRGAQFGVFAMRPLAKRTCFGPYEGIRRKTNRGNGYTWKVYGRDGESYMIDARSLERSNWMRYVNCSPTEEQQNLVAFQRNGSIYFRTRRDIIACEELTVWYGKSFAKDLGLIDYKGQSSEPKTADATRRPIFKCDSCDDAFALRKCLLTHKLRHHVKKMPPGRFECRLCPYTCQNRWVIKRHVLIHTKDKPFKCPDCDKGFTQRGSLKIHQRIHTGERPFECATCGQRFRDPSVLSRHQNLHTGYSKVHACPVCGRPFSLKSDVKRHLRTHTGERPYACTICDKPFRDLGHWRRHERLVHKKEYTLKCPHCGKGAAAMWNLRQHLRARHPPEKPEQPADTENGDATGNVKPGRENAEMVAEGTEGVANNEVGSVTGEAAAADEEMAIVDGEAAFVDGEER